MTYDYKSPLLIDKIAEDIRTKYDDSLCQTIISLCSESKISVDKDELVKALNYDRNQYRVGYSDGYDDGYFDGMERIKKLSEWHDLRKNKDDLPDRNGQFMIYYTMNCEAYKKVYPYVESYYPDYGWSTPSHVEVVAWKEIEPLESDDHASR